MLVKVDRSRMVSAEAGLSVAAGTTGPVKLEAYNETAGALVGLAEGTAGPSASTTLRVERPGGDIYWAAFYSVDANKPLELDFFQTDAVINTEPPPPPPQPDFQIEADTPNSLGLAPGGTATSYLTIRRLAGSTGRIGFSAENLPRGVTASFVPNPATGGDRERVRVTFTAAADAPAVSDGIVFIRARPVDATAGADVRSATTFLSVAGRVDLRLRGIDVFQAVQGLGTLLPGPATNGGDYRGTRLGAGQKTVARVFADATGAAPPGVNASVVLRGYDAAGRERPDSPLFPIWAPNGIAQRETPGVFPDERADPAAAYTFVLPPTWTHGKLNLRAGISVPESPASPTRCPSSNAPAPTAPRTTALTCATSSSNACTRTGSGPSASCATAAGRSPRRLASSMLTRAVTPGPLCIPNGYVATLDNTRIHCAVLGKSPDPKCESVPANNDPKDDDSELADWKNAATRNLVYDWSLNYRGPGDFNVGVNIGTARPGRGDLRDHELRRWAGVGERRPTAADLRRTRVLPSLRPQHASSCGKAKNGEPWPPDERGRLQSLGLDRRDGSGGPTNYAGSGAAPPPFRVFQDTSTDGVLRLHVLLRAAQRRRSGLLGLGPQLGSRVRVPTGEAPPVPEDERPRGLRTARSDSRSGAANARGDGLRRSERGQDHRRAAPGTGPPRPRRGSAFSLVGRNAAGAVVATAPPRRPATPMPQSPAARAATGPQHHQGRDRRRRNRSRRTRPQRERSPARVRRPRTGKGRVTIRWRPPTATATPSV